MNPSGNPTDQPDASNPVSTPPTSDGTIINPTPTVTDPTATPSMPPDLPPAQPSTGTPKPPVSPALTSPSDSQPDITPTQAKPNVSPAPGSTQFPPYTQQVDNPTTPPPDTGLQPQPAPLTPSPLSPAPQKSKKKLFVILAVAMLGILGLVIGIVLLGSLKSTPKYSDLKSANVGNIAGQKIAFSYPEEMEEVINQGNEAKYAHYQDDSKKAVYAEINVDSAQTGALSPEDIASFNGILKSKKEGYQEIVDALKKDTFKDQTDITYSNFTDFKNDKISNAVQTDITFKSTSTGKPGKGRLILAFGKERLFGMILVSEQSVWEKNSETWDKVVNSWSIDQP